MKILGIAGSPRKIKTSNSYKLLNVVLENTGIDYEVIRLVDKKISGCVACLRCAKDNICKLEDDYTEIREKIIKADAYVVASPNYYSTINAITHAFLERFFQFRHQGSDFLWGKLGIAIGVGGISGKVCCETIERFFSYSFIQTIAKIHAQGVASCYSCGYGETCTVGVPKMLSGSNIKITKKPDILEQVEIVEQAKKAGILLANKLTNNYDKNRTTSKMMALMNSMMQENV